MLEFRRVPRPWWMGCRLSVRRWLFVLILSAAPGSLCVGAPGSPDGTVAQRESLFDSEIRPLLMKHCVACHGGEERTRGGLRVTSREALLQGGDTGPAVDVDDWSSSLLLEAIRYEGLEMPPTGQLSRSEIARLTKWIELGIPWGNEPIVSRSKKASTSPPEVDDEARSFWSFRPIRRPVIPSTKNQNAAVNPIDTFLAAGWRKAGLEPAPPASRRQLIRRLYYDVTGLPPTPEQVRDFTNDKSPTAYAELVDRLLASPHYGEQWARHWLDLVRYAETNSYERDGDKPYVWRYRDYVIRSFNDDKPYDQFLREQLAGDELEEVTPDSIIATGYYRLGIWDDEPVDREQALYDDLDDIMATTCQVFLGVTVNCARCHDHKLDPIPQKDYYRMLAFFSGLTRLGERGGNSIAKNSLRSIATAEERTRHVEATEEYQRSVARLERGLATVESLVKKDLSPVERQDFKHEQHRVALIKKRVPHVITQEQSENYEQWTAELANLRRSPPAALRQALCVTETGRDPRDTFVLVRGNAHSKGEKVAPGFLSVVSDETPQLIPRPDNATTSGRRRVLANWIVSEDNPLTARVMVNRIWQFHFGRGIVRTPNNFGFRGAAPTHPELLDWLADRFVANGWRLKSLHRMILLSDAYRMGTVASAKAAQRDPTNEWLSHFPSRRLTGEEIRDSLLAVNGSLNRQMFGPSVFSLIPREVLATQSRPGSGWGTSEPAQRARRSIYIKVKRSLLTPILSAFDYADPDASCPNRFVTTQPTQALGMLNSQLVNQEAGVLAALLRHRHPDNIDAQLRLAFWQVLQRPASTSELDRALGFVRQVRREYDLPIEAALERFCLVLLNLNEFVYLD